MIMKIDNSIPGDVLSYTGCHNLISFEEIYNAADGTWSDFGIWILDFGFKVFCLL